MITVIHICYKQSMEIRTLKSFLAVASLKNFSAAARKLNTVQPAISRQISDLEKELGVRLFWRNTHKVKITAAGQNLLDNAQELLALERWAKEQARLAAQGKIGSLRIGYVGPACFSFIPWLVQDYSKLYPDVRIQLQEMPRRQQLHAFKTGQLDVGFSGPLSRTERKDFSVQRIYVDTLIAILPEAHPLAKEKSLELNELKKDPFVMLKRSESVGMFDLIISSCQREKFVPVISSQPENMQTVLTEVASGLGVSVLPRYVRKMYSKGCVFIPIQDQKPSVPTELHYLSYSPPPTVEAFVERTIKAKQKIQRHMLK